MFTLYVRLPFCLRSSFRTERFKNHMQINKISYLLDLVPYRCACRDDISRLSLPFEFLRACILYCFPWFLWWGEGQTKIDLVVVVATNPFRRFIPRLCNIQFGLVFL